MNFIQLHVYVTVVFENFGILYKIKMRICLFDIFVIMEDQNIVDIKRYKTKTL